MQPDNSDQRPKRPAKDQFSTKGQGGKTQRDEGDDLSRADTTPPMGHPNRTPQQSEGGDFNGPDKGRVRR